MLDRIITVTGNYITQYVKSTTIYKSLLVMIALSWLLYPLFGLITVCVALTIGFVVWLVTEYLYTKQVEEELDEEES